VMKQSCVRDRVGCLPSACQTSDRVACERVEEDTDSSAMMRVSLTRISYKTIDESVNAVCMKRTRVRCHVISANGMKGF
jgi:hypothetical protein